MSDIVPVNAIESAVIGGDLSKLTPEQRVNYYNAVCKSMGLNPLTSPFDYIVLNGKLTLYARKDATEQLRKIHNVSIGKPDIQFQDDWIIVTVLATDAQGRADSDIGVVSKKDMRGDFGNALMKAVTKAKRRATLSICGLGMLDETEIETIPDAKIVTTNDQPPGELQEPQPGIDYSGLPEAVRTMKNSKGTLYIDIPTEQLSHMTNALDKALRNNGLSEEEKAEKSDKLAAARAILEARLELTHPRSLGDESRPRKEAEHDPSHNPNLDAQFWHERR